jgi:hypothetical protein
VRKSETGESGGGDSETLSKGPPIKAGFKSSAAIQAGTKAAIRSLVELLAGSVNSARGAQRSDSQHTQP